MSTCSWRRPRTSAGHACHYDAQDVQVSNLRSFNSVVLLMDDHACYYSRAHKWGMPCILLFRATPNSLFVLLKFTFHVKRRRHRDACEDQRVDRSIVSHLERPTALAGSIASASLMLVNVVVEEALRTEPVGVDTNSCASPLLTSIHKNLEMFRQVLAQS